MIIPLYTSCMEGPFAFVSFLIAEAAVNVGISHSTELNARNQRLLKELFIFLTRKKIVIALLKVIATKFLRDTFELDSGLVTVKVMVMLMLIMVIRQYLELLLKKYRHLKPKFSFYFLKNIAHHVLS